MRLIWAKALFLRIMLILLVIATKRFSKVYKIFASRAKDLPLARIRNREMPIILHISLLIKAYTKTSLK
jgi:hypothetical protein